MSSSELLYGYADEARRGACLYEHFPSEVFGIYYPRSMMMKNGFSISHIKSFMSLRSVALLIAIAMVAFAFNTSSVLAHTCDDADPGNIPDCLPTIEL